MFESSEGGNIQVFQCSKIMQLDTECKCEMCPRCCTSVVTTKSIKGSRPLANSRRDLSKQQLNVIVDTACEILYAQHQFSTTGQLFATNTQQTQYQH